ncbi:MAG: competence/damage-inducible protein A, partial [Terricaulis sp.]
LRMARIPDGAVLIDNPVSKAPGFQLGNVFVMAGVPSIMRGMLQDIGHRIEGGAIVSARTVRAKGVPEGDIADALGELEIATNGLVSFGSYPWFTQEGFGVHLVARSADPVALEKAVSDLMQMIRARGAEPEEVADPS